MPQKSSEKYMVKKGNSLWLIVQRFKNCESQNLTIQTLSSTMVTSCCNVVVTFLFFDAMFQFEINIE